MSWRSRLFRPRENRLAAFAASFTGYPVVPADGGYTFTLAADTGALFRVH